MLYSVFSKTETINVIAEILNNHIEQTLLNTFLQVTAVFACLVFCIVVFLFMGLEIGHKL